MKIYIPSILPITLKDKLTNILDFNKNIIMPEKIEKQEIISEDFGIHIIEKNKIIRIEPIFKPKYELIKDYNEYTLLFDLNSEIIISNIFQLPVKYILTNITKFEYKTDKKSKLKLVIECITDKDTNKLETNYIPIDFYFNYNNDNFNLQDILNNIFFQEEFNMFLSQLN